MSRIARVVAVGHPHHITQRGNYRQDVFLDDSDREKYLTCLYEHSHKYKLTILAYCLMTNHVHFVVVPQEEDSLSKTFNFAHMRYSQYFNKKLKTNGHLWQGRFFSCVLDEKYLMACVRYVERNPVRAKIVKEAWGWKWSSARVHCGIAEDKFKLNAFFDYMEGIREDWRGFLEEMDDKEDTTEIKKHTLTGFPVGSEDFIGGLEKKLGRVLQAMSRGRPGKKKDDKK